MDNLYFKINKIVKEKELSEFFVFREWKYEITSNFKLFLCKLVHIGGKSIRGGLYSATAQYDYININLNCLKNLIGALHNLNGKIKIQNKRLYHQPKIFDFSYLIPEEIEFLKLGANVIQTYKISNNFKKIQTIDGIDVMSCSNVIYIFKPTNPFNRIYTSNSLRETISIFNKICNLNTLKKRVNL